MDNTFWISVGALIPSIGVGLLFWFAMRAVIRADRTERAAVARMEAAQDAEDAAAAIARSPRNAE